MAASSRNTFAGIAESPNLAWQGRILHIVHRTQLILSQQILTSGFNRQAESKAIPHSEFCENRRKPLAPAGIFHAEWGFQATTQRVLVEAAPAD
jgi:hypothetical protein